MVKLWRLLRRFPNSVWTEGVRLNRTLFAAKALRTLHGSLGFRVALAVAAPVVPFEQENHAKSCKTHLHKGG